jgi:FMN phosphatase YigB (HAD superfamily)
MELALSGRISEMCSQMIFPKVIFFDLGDTLVTDVGTSGSPLKFILIDNVKTQLERLKSKSYSLGIISNTGDVRVDEINAALDDVGILALFDSKLLVYSSDPSVGVEKPHPEIFKIALARAGLTATPNLALFVANEDDHRPVAQEVGMQACPEPAKSRAFLDRLIAGDGGNDAGP